MRVKYRKLSLMCIFISLNLLLYTKIQHAFHHCSLGELLDCTLFNIYNSCSSKNCKYMEDQGIAQTKDYVGTHHVHEKNGDTDKKSYLHIVTHYTMLFDDVWKPNFTEHYNSSQIKDRQLELSESLQRNLNHPLVSNIHLLIYNQRELEYINDLHLSNSHKLIMQITGHLPRFDVAVKYINKNLLNQTVVFMNGDCYLGEGFEMVNATLLKSQKIMYALTRRGKKERQCTVKDYCGVDYGYTGSHDAFIFYLETKISDSVIRVLNFPCGAWGSENIFIWVFTNELKRVVLNPCIVIKVYHNHCSEVRSWSKPRVNDDRSAGAKFTSLLQRH